MPTLPVAAGGTPGGRPAHPALCRSCSCPPAAGTAAAAQSPPPDAPKQKFCFETELILKIKIKEKKKKKFSLDKSTRTVILELGHKTVRIRVFA